jgi:hypothetical protein
MRGSYWLRCVSSKSLGTVAFAQRTLGMRVLTYLRAVVMRVQIFDPDSNGTVDIAQFTTVIG